ncbi:hypothetical protein [Pedobacter gandavensis]|uniref:DUF4221 domain-containing protein n=1 Tax=Pedobacter gandavensis TaxID=2679963 RepID=A0ABR6EW79_9SPHI|nr:hypothetical protein [Pedobacter gandavensis]MBB2149467.1 hypothetical protein [Pedobacter gandavensis]
MTRKINILATKTLKTFSFTFFLSCISLFLHSCSNESNPDKHPEIKYFPEFNASNTGIQLQALSTAGEDVKRVYVSRDKKKLILLVKAVEKSPLNNYHFRVYDEQLNLIKEITAADLDGLFGQDDLENIYAGKGYFEHSTFQYRPIQQLLVTDDPAAKALNQPGLQPDTTNNTPSSKSNVLLVQSMKRFEQMSDRYDTLLSFQRKDYKGSFYFLKKSGKVYQFFFKDCAYCESKFNAAESISEYRAADNGADQVLKPSERTLRGLIQKEPLFFYHLKIGHETADFKISYRNENLSDQIKRIEFAGKPLLLYQLPGKAFSTLYFFKNSN